MEKEVAHRQRLKKRRRIEQSGGIHQTPGTAMIIKMKHLNHNDNLDADVGEDNDDDGKGGGKFLCQVSLSQLLAQI